MNASSIQPTAPLTAAEEAVMTPIWVRVRSNSIIMRPKIGTAVIEKAVAMNKAYPARKFRRRDEARTHTRIPTPGMKGSAIPRTLIKPTARLFSGDLSWEKSNSSPPETSA